MGFEKMLFVMALLAENALRKETDAIINQTKKQVMDNFKQKGLGKAEQLIALGIFKRFATELEAEIKAGNGERE